MTFNSVVSGIRCSASSQYWFFLPAFKPHSEYRLKNIWKLNKMADFCKGHLNTGHLKVCFPYFWRTVFRSQLQFCFADWWTQRHCGMSTASFSLLSHKCQLLIQVQWHHIIVTIRISDECGIWMLESCTDAKWSGFQMTITKNIKQFLQPIITQLII